LFSNVLFEVLFELRDWGDNGGMHILIDGGNIGTKLSHFLLGFCEIRVQGSEESFQAFSTGMGHDDEWMQKGQVMGYGWSVSQWWGLRVESNGVNPK
jgi:hypothetical protein